MTDPKCTWKMYEGRCINRAPCFTLLTQQYKTSIALLLTILFCFLRLGQGLVRLPRRRRQLFLFVRQRPAVRTDLHHRRHHRVRRQFGRQHVLLHQERPPPRDRIQRLARKKCTSVVSQCLWLTFCSLHATCESLHLNLFKEIASLC